MVRKPIFTSEDPDAHPADSSDRTRIVGNDAQVPDDRTRLIPEPSSEAAADISAASAPETASDDAPLTRVHGYEESPATSSGAMSAAAPVTGWLVVTDGPGRGASITLSVGVNSIGRGPDVSARVDFGDEAISRDAHAYATYDHEQRKFLLSHAGQTNIVRLNDEPVVAGVDLADRDLVRIGDTTLQFVAYCGPDFDWSAS